MRTAVLTLLLFAAPAWADPPRLEIAAEIKAQPGAWVVVAPQTDCKSVTYVGLDGLSAFPSSELKDPRRLVVNAPAAGRYRFVAVGTLNDEPAVVSFVIVVGDAPPGPTPGPGPTPPSPKPDDPEPDPFGAATATAVGPLRVLIVFESADVQRLPAPYITALYAKDVTNYLNAHCAKGPDGAPMVRHYDKDIDLSAETKVWQDALRRANQKIAAYKPFSLPKTDPDYRPMVWLMIGNGKNGYEGPLPANKDTYLNLLRKYGGQ